MSCPSSNDSPARGHLQTLLRNGSIRQPPFRERTADVDLFERRVANQIEALVACRRVRNNPIADLMAAVASVANLVLQGRGKLCRIAVLEQLDTGAVELFVDLPHARLADEMAQAAGRQHRDAKIIRIAF